MQPASGSDGDDGRSVGDGGPQRIGWFRYFFDEDRWEWSPEVERLHGYEPGTVNPTTELVLSHKHPDDFRQVADTIDMIRRRRQAFRSRHRIRDAHGNVHFVAVLGDELRNESGEVVGTYGFYVDLTAEERVHQSQMTTELLRIAERRSAIEQAKGMLMMVYNIDEGAAFNLLRWRSQEANIKLVRLAEQLVADFRQANHSGDLSRARYDQLFMTAHERAR
ncbi:antitermination regulator [Mycobacterium sp. ACS1612]|nr:antitermination regulator [Mycobacterium sp. ACS1612]